MTEGTITATASSLEATSFQNLEVLKLNWQELNDECRGAFMFYAFGFKEAPWKQRWSLDPNGSDVSQNVYAFLRHLGQNGWFYVALEGDAIQGFAAGEILTQERVDGLGFGEVGDGYQSSILVSTKWRKRGLGAYLAKVRLDDYWKFGAPAAWMRTLKDAVNVQKLYREHFGFEVVKTVQVTLGGMPSTRVIMRGVRPS